ncbi:helix-turn-helix transcriptional regulator [Timonella sp. A28]|uniref:helix-turn-helix transcriptional regulator n=1 Tax=Timonella sp. A28 TaxID=3442640 RepID=UPI003EB7D131
MTINYLSIQEVAARLGIAVDTANKYKLPEPDALVGKYRGWLPETIDTWDAARPRKRRVQRPDSE